MRSELRSANFIWWVTMIIVMVRRAARSRRICRIPPTSSGSSADVTSSNSMTSGHMASARAIPTRCFWPPDSCAG
ncbi:Protein of uncharacterised function (DUF1602) [Bordetella pertussis]|nr:Protein of uncharacterised function (DUF1602) [Bordetella pertussis]